LSSVRSSSFADAHAIIHPRPRDLFNEFVALVVGRETASHCPLSLQIVENRSADFLSHCEAPTP